MTNKTLWLRLANQLSKGWGAPPKTDYRGLPLPRLEDDGKIITGHNQIAEHIAELTEFKEQWEKFQSDACYCDE